MKRQLLRALSALAVSLAAVRVAFLHRMVTLDALPDRLRRAGPLPAALQDPALLAAAVDRLATYLPPWGLGPCLKRSLLLVDLWSRCGLEPRLHFALRRGESRRVEGHAWVSSARTSFLFGAPAPGSGYVETWMS